MQGAKAIPLAPCTPFTLCTVPMLQITKQQLTRALNFPTLIEALRAAFAKESYVPVRHHHDYPTSSTLLLMPAWQGEYYFGLKVITVTPENAGRNLPTIQGTYLLFDRPTGSPLAQMDAKILTNWRTAAASALASDYLSRADSESLLVVGTGALAPYLIRAHAAVRPIKKVWVWGRNREKADRLVQQLAEYPWEMQATDELEGPASRADIISTATMSAEPLISGAWLQPGQHLDLVGSYKPDMREADDKCIERARVFVDTREAAPRESGDLAIPIQKGILSDKDILADLFELCRGRAPGRQKREEITLFKSVGHALEDLATAALVHRAYQK